MTHVDAGRTSATAGAATQQRAASVAATQAVWFLGVSALAFLIPYVFTTLIDANHDLYYLLYFVVSLSALSLYVRATGIDLRELSERSWKLSLLLGVAATAFVVWNVLANNDATPRPGGAYFAFELIWRGAAYGIVDALLLSAFPAMVTFTVMRGEISGVARRVEYAILTTVLVLFVTASYHLGYQQFRDDGVAAPEIGNTVISLPVIATANPLGSLVAHASMHVTAVSHAYETDTFLPPQQQAD